MNLEVNVENLFEARFVMTGHLGRNLPIDMGPSVVLRKENVCIVVTSRVGPHYAPQFFQTAGHDPFRAAVVVAKSSCGFRADYAAHARQIISVQAPGCARSDFWNYEFKNITRPC